MIVKCPSCSTQFRLDRERLRGKRVTLRCVRCRQTFKIEVVDSSPENRRLSALVAHSDPRFCAKIAEILSESNISSRICHEGTEALRLMEEALPQVAVIDVALPGIFGFEMVGQIRSNPRLKAIKVILLPSVYNKMAYKRRPSSLYGADDYIEGHHISQDLVPKIYALVPGASPSDWSEASDRTPPKDETSEEKVQKTEDRDVSTDLPSQKVEDQEASTDLLSQEVEKAKRLARIIVSDIALYNQERVEEGIRTGTLFDLLAPEIEEGRRLFAERVDPEISAGEDFLKKALEELIEQGNKKYPQQVENKVV